MVNDRTVLQLVVLVLLWCTPLSIGNHVPLPALYELDDWTECAHLYCMARVILAPDGVVQNAGLHLQVTDDFRHFRRTLLDRGVCVPTAVDRESELNLCGRSKLPKDAWNASDRYILDRALFPPDFHLGERTERVVSAVINRQLELQHPGLAAYTEIEYCLESGNSRLQYDYAIALTLALAVVLGCILSFNARSWIWQEFRSFSARDEPKQFLLFNLYKTFGMLGVVFAHCLLFGPFLMPMRNTDDLERVIAHPDARLYRLLCPFMMLVFFTMSSMLLTVKLLHQQPAPAADRRAKSPPRPTFRSVVVHRLIRLQPLNLLTIGFCALAYDRFVGGPLAPRQLIVEQSLCRASWWMNILFISNFNMHKPCLPHSSYISADFQLFVVIALIVFASFRWPHKTTHIFACAIVCSFLGPFLTVLWTEFDPIGPGNLHEMRFFMFDSAFLAQLYTPCYNNLGWSVGGMLAGFVYDRYQRCGIGHHQRTILTRSVSLFAGGAFVVLLLFTHLTLATAESSSLSGRWWLAACYATFKLSAAAFFSAIMLRVLLTEEVFAASPVAQMGAKLYYCVYLIHLPIFRIVFSRETATATVTMQLLFRMALQVFGISYALALLLHYTFEKPVMNFLRKNLVHRL